MGMEPVEHMDSLVLFFTDSASGVALSTGWRISHPDGGSTVFWVELSSDFLDSSLFPSIALSRFSVLVFCNCYCSNFLPLLNVIVFVCSLGFFSVLLGNDLCGLSKL